MGDKEELYVSGFTNCKACNSFLTEYNECSNCHNRLCDKCIEKNKEGKCPICTIFPFIIEKNEQMNRLLKNMKLFCKYCKKQFKSAFEFTNHECIVQVLKCRYCDFKTRDDNVFVKHINDKHKILLFEIMDKKEK